MAVHRNRVVYQSEALFISPNATGYHYTGSEGYGLTTPPIDAAQVTGGAHADGSPYGWSCEDEWPIWSDKIIEATPAFFDGTADIDDADETFEITLKNFTDTTPLAVNGDGTTSLQALIDAGLAAVNPNLVGVSVDATQGDLTLVPDNGTTVTFQAGVAGGKSSLTLAKDAQATPNDAFDFESVQDGLGANLISLKIVDSTTPITVALRASDGGVDLTIGIDVAGTQTIAQAVTALNADSTFSSYLTVAANGSATVADVPAIPTAGQPGNDFTPMVGATAGTDQALAATAVGVESKQLPVKVTAKIPGTTFNGVEVTGDDTNDVATLFAALPNGSDIDVTQGGSHILNRNQKITLQGGTNGDPVGHGSIIQQLKRVQTANYGFSVNRTDVNQFGHLSRLDSILVEAPTVNLDLSYYILDGFNERQLGFVTDGATNTLSGMMSAEASQAGNNFFILTVPEARDAVLGDARINAAGDEDSKTVISVGNGYVTDYSVDISVGAIPTANVTVEGMNIRSDVGTTGNDVPSLDMRNGSLMSNAWTGGKGVCNEETKCTGLFSLPPAQSGYEGCEDVAALRPGDVVLDLQDAGLISKNNEGDGNDTMGSAHIQSASFSIPLARTTLQRLGSTFGFTKSPDVPITATVTINALLSDLKQGALTDLLCKCEDTDLSVKIYDPHCVDCTVKDDGLAMIYTMKGAKLDSENFSSTLGDNKTVELSFSCQVGGADDPAKGIYISGKEAGNADLKGFPPAWTGANGATNQPTTINGATNVLGYRK